MSARLARSRAVRVALIVVLPSLVTPGAAQAEQTVRDVLSFLVTNRSIATDDFVRDEQAAEATSDAIGSLLGVELATLPIASSASGFIYRFDPALGTIARLSQSFGVFFTERSMTTGKSQLSVGLGYRSATFDKIDGRNLRDQTLVSTASSVRGAAEPFDVETIALRLQMESVTAVASYGLTDRLEVSAAVPLVRVTLQGERVDTYRGREFLQARGSVSAVGLADVAVRAKYNLSQTSRGGLAAGAEVRLPSGNKAQLLGAGRMSVKPRLLVSLERERLSLDADIGYSLRGVAQSFDYSTGIGYVATSRLTLVGELHGRRLNEVGRLTETIEPHPRLVGIDTLRLTAVNESSSRLAAVAGFKWNVAGGWLLNANVVRPLTSAGLKVEWLPAVSLDYAFGQ